MARIITVAATIALLSGAAHAQKFDLVVNGGKSVTFNSPEDAGLVEVSLFLDTEGATEFPFADFESWLSFGGSFESSGGTWVGFTENDGEYTGINPFGVIQADTWTLGRRPQGIPNIIGGSMRSAGTGYANPITFVGGSTLEPNFGSYFEGLADIPVLGAAFVDTSPRLEVFRALIDFTAVDAGRYDLAFDPFSAQIERDVPDDPFTPWSVVDLMTVSPATVTIIPAPASAALLGLAGLTAMRRRH